MSVLTGLLSRSGEDVAPKLLEMLRRGTPARSDAYGVATPDGVEHHNRQPEFSSLCSPIALGYRLVKVTPTDKPQPIHQGSQALAVTGRLWDTGEPDVLEIADLTRDGATRGFRRLLEELRGSWAAIAAEEGRIVCCRDPIGAIPLYYGYDKELSGVASNAKTLRAVGLEPLRVKPGHLLELTPDGVSVEKVAEVERPAPMGSTIEEATRHLNRLLIRATSRACSGIFSPTLAFSGGIDSVLLAFYLKRVGAKPRLACVGVEGSPDLEAAERAAECLGLPLSLGIYGEVEIEEHLDPILASVEEADPMKIGVAIPLYLVALGASSRSCRVVVSGNGSDELFGGYARYVEEYQTRGDSVRDTMYGDVARSHEVNFERDWKICADLGAELRLPYADPDLTRFALALQLSYKLPKEGKEPRKIILRRLASDLGLPDDVTRRPKKAAQYSSGAAKVLAKLAKRRGKTVGGYLAERLSDLREGGK